MPTSPSRSRRRRLVAAALGALAAALPMVTTAASAAPVSGRATTGPAVPAVRPDGSGAEQSRALARLTVNAAAPHAGRAEVVGHPDADTPGSSGPGSGAARPAIGGSPAPAPASAAVPAPRVGANASTPTPSGPLGIDVASFQKNVDWAQVSAAGIVYAYAKATEGTYYTNPYFGQQYTGSYDQGLIHGAYHFAIPDNSTGAAQADYFVAHGGGWSADGHTLPGLLDIEYNPYGPKCYGLTPAQLSAWVGSFDQEYLTLTGRPPVLYTNADFWNACTGGSDVASADPLLLAAWGPAPTPIPIGWTSQTIWQYTDHNALGMDGEVFNGSTGVLSSFLVSGHPVVPVSGPGAYVSVPPLRLMDTRSGLGAPGPLGPNASVTLDVVGQDGVPGSGVAAVLLNVTAVGATAAGNVAVYADGTPTPGTSNVNFGPGRTVANLVVTSVGADGLARLTLQTSGTVQLVVDVVGYVPGGTVSTPGSYVAVAPTRLMDTRQDLGAFGPVAPDSSMSLGVVGRAGIPGSGVAAVLLNVTAVGATAGGNVAVYADGTPRPATSNVNFADQTVANLVVAPVGADGRVSLATQSPGTVQLVVDVAGYVLGGSATGPDTYVPLTPARLVDTRSGLGASGPIPPNGSVSVGVAGRDGIPSTGVAAVLLNVTAVAATSGGNVAVYADGTPTPGTSNVNFGPSRTVANLAVASVGADGGVRLTVQSPGTVQLVVDVVGYITTG